MSEARDRGGELITLELQSIEHYNCNHGNDCVHVTRGVPVLRAYVYVLHVHNYRARTYPATRENSQT